MGLFWDYYSPKSYQARCLRSTSVNLRLFNYREHENSQSFTNYSVDAKILFHFLLFPKIVFELCGLICHFQKSYLYHPKKGKWNKSKNKFTQKSLVWRPKWVSKKKTQLPIRWKPSIIRNPESHWKLFFIFYRRHCIV